MKLFLEFVILLANVMSQDTPASEVTGVLILVSPQSFLFPCHSPDPFRIPVNMNVTIGPKCVAMNGDPCWKVYCDCHGQ
jgi:hypothetical protein